MFYQFFAKPYKINNYGKNLAKSIYTLDENNELSDIAYAEYILGISKSSTKIIEHPMLKTTYQGYKVLTSTANNY